ncbi:MAG: MetQ/NlpA family ABC transporter substrate-binding protein [Spirochaetales bacterium]|uniref:MetQ/NlpA family ABC transporter substrate-binding protein n=1 Tax=Candidatus Thalassospirochaeta sargassi TaxID=3119039 RepID=A0AAJ1IC08_9SPIO|nr:MetQ/NlpA family ABC transporter substrate-binding protein [Spirochaetales bacterium]
MKRTKIFTIISAVILIATSAFCGGSQESFSSKTISVGLLPDVDSIPFAIADINGYFTEEGVDVNLQQFKNPLDRDTAFQSGETVAVVSDLLAASLFINAGFNVKAVSMTNGSYKLLSAPNSPAASIPELKGLSLGISKNTIIEYATDKMLRTAGLSDSDIKKEIIPQIPVRLEMLSSGKIDGATLAEPLATISVLSGCNVLISTDKLGINPGILLFDEDFLNANKTLVSSFYKAYNRAVEYINNTDKEEYIDAIIEVMGFPPAAKTVMELPDYTVAQAPQEHEADEVTAWMLERKLINYKISYSELVDSSCLP